MKKTPLGSDFEEAVYKFSNSLDPKAQVILNHTVQDRDTGKIRQCDVWINAKIGGHWPISILVSCKDHIRKLHVGDIGAFLDEVRSTSASTGVLYSRSGYTKPALLKAKVNGCSCCRLYRNEPADIPSIIQIDQYVCNEQFRFELIKGSIFKWNTWDEIFAIENGEETVLDTICKGIVDAEQESINESKTSLSFPHDWGIELDIPCGEIANTIKIRVYGHWKKYRARTEAVLMNGSYCLTNESYHGSLSGPSIDTKSSHPGESWIEISDEEISLVRPRMIAILYRASMKETILEQLGTRSIN